MSEFMMNFVSIYSNGPTMASDAQKEAAAAPAATTEVGEAEERMAVDPQVPTVQLTVPTASPTGTRLRSVTERHIV